MSTDRRIRIVDFSTHLSGPMASHLLAGLGADVVKIENTRTGDGNRGFVPLVNGQGLFHVMLNSGTRSLAIDKHSPHWTEVTRAAAAWADAVIVGGRPVDAERLGLGFDALAAANGDLIYCQISGYGEEGPWRDYSAHGQQPDALAGLVPLVWADGMPETAPGWRTAGSTLAGIFAALAITAALVPTQARPGPRKVAVSLWASAMWWNWRDLGTYANNGEAWPDYSDLGSRYALYPTADQRALLLAPAERKFWHEFVHLLDLPQAWKERGSWDASRMDFGTSSEYDGEREMIASRIKSRPLAEWSEIFGATSIPFSPLLTWVEALESEHARVSGVMSTTEIDGRLTHIMASPIKMTGLEETVGKRDSWPPPPKLGEQSAEILEEFGLDALAREIDS